MNEDVRARVDQVLRDSKRCGSSPDPLVRIAWLIHGLDLHHRTDGRSGYTLEKTVEYVTSSILHMNQEQLEAGVSMNQHVPTTKEIADGFAAAWDSDADLNEAKMAPARAAFYRWLAAHDAEIQGRFQEEDK